MKNLTKAAKPSAFATDNGGPAWKGPGAKAGLISGLLAIAGLLLAPATVRALPSFARQMNMQCIMCHTAFPELTEFGRQFKLSGYTMSADQSNLPPIAVMLQPSWTHTSSDQVGGAAPGFGPNNN